MKTRITQSCDYKLIQFQLTREYLVVYAVECEDRPGKCRLEACPVDALGLAVVTEWENEIAYDDHGVPGARVGRGLLGRTREIVGLVLDEEGVFGICNEWSNFAGLCRVGDDIGNVTGCLSSGFLDNLVREPVDLHRSNS
jgi:hypothetical protein